LPKQKQTNNTPPVNMRSISPYLQSLRTTTEQGGQTPLWHGLEHECPHSRGLSQDWRARWHMGQAAITVSHTIDTQTSRENNGPAQHAPPKKARATNLTTDWERVQAVPTGDHPHVANAHFAAAAGPVCTFYWMQTQTAIAGGQWFTNHKRSLGVP
jgi:hypothetical protein